MNLQVLSSLATHEGKITFTTKNKNKMCIYLNHRKKKNSFQFDLYWYSYQDVHFIMKTLYDMFVRLCVLGSTLILRRIFVSINIQ